jgi:predicted transcriptional regulator
MQVMTEKGLLTRDESSMKHIYIPVHDEQEVKNHFLLKFVNTYYKGSASKLVMQLLGHKKTPKKDIDYIKEQIKKLKD